MRAGLLAGWVGIVSSLLLFGLKTGLGLSAGSVSVVADGFNLLSHLANSVTLTVSGSLLRRSSWWPTLDTAASVPESQFGPLAAKLEEALRQALPNLAYASFYVTPRFAY